MPAKKKHDISVVIGRFQPFHNGHLELINTARSIADQTIIMVGSANQSRDTRNPWTDMERRQMITQAIVDSSSFTKEQLRWFTNNHEGMIASLLGCYLVSMPDAPYNEQAWIRRIQMVLEERSQTMDIENPRVCIVGQEKDYTSYYLKMFPGWSYHPQELIKHTDSTKSIDATAIRSAYFDQPRTNLIDALMSDSPLTQQYTCADLPPASQAFLNQFMLSPEYANLCEEYRYVKNYRASLASYKYPPIFTTTDAVVIQAAHILLVTRKKHPGKGLLALPGGFVNQNELLIASAIRELKEETRISVPEAVLRGSIKKSKVYDSPTRSQRGRVISHAYLFELEGNMQAGYDLPKVRGADDAKRAKWYPLAAIRPDQIFEDHYHIIQDMLGING